MCVFICKTKKNDKPKRKTDAIQKNISSLKN